MRLSCALRAAVLTSIVLLAGAAPGVADEHADARIRRAREILKLFLDEKFDEFVAIGDEQVRGSFTAEQARAVKSQLEAQFGPYEGEQDARYQRIGELDAVTFTLLHAKNRLKLVVSLDAEDRMAGFRIVGVESREPYQSPAYVDPGAFRDEPVTVRTGEYELPGTLSLPVTRARHPGLVLVHGSGPHDEDETVLANKPFRDLAGGLASRGVAVLRYEKRTHKYGDRMDPHEVKLEQETIDDALAAVALLRERPEIDPQRVFVLGHSLGGMAAPLIAQRDDRLAGIVIMAGNARSILDLLEDQIEYVSGIDGEVSDEEATLLADVRRQTEAIRSGEFDGSERLLGPPLAYWADLHGRDPVGAAEALERPILIVHGGRDYQVTDKDFAIWEKRLGGRENVTLKRYPRLNHLMVAGEGRSRPEEYATVGHVDEQVVADLAEWLQSRAPHGATAVDRGATAD